jgi:hypothetical protein
VAEVVTFWLDNKYASGTKAAQLGDQVLVNYRDKCYIIMKGAALMKGSKPLRYSPSSLPAIWKKALRVDPSVADVPTIMDPDKPAQSNVIKKTPVKDANEVSVMPEPTPLAPSAPPVQPKQQVIKARKATRKSDANPAAQTVVAAECPYCGQQHEIPLEKGRRGKPFFHSCTRCKSDFAVRFVQVTMYQAQVAGFR